MTARNERKAFVDGLGDDAAETALYVLQQKISERFPTPDKPLSLEERIRPSKLPGSAFFALSRRNDPATIARLQDVSPINNIDDLTADFWPEDETVDEFTATIREWRREGG